MKDPPWANLDDLGNPVTDAENCSLFSFDRDINQSLPSSLAVGFFSPFTDFDEITTSVPGYKPSSIAGSGCENSTDSSPGSSWPQCPLDHELCSAASLSCGSHQTGQQDIELCLTLPWDNRDLCANPLSHVEPISSPTEPSQDGRPKSGPTKSSSSNSKYPSRLRTKSSSMIAPATAADTNNSVQATLLGRTNHALVEHRYRKNLNARLDQLQCLLASVESNAEAEDEQHAGAAIGNSPKADEKIQQPKSGKIKKSNVLLGAIEYIKHSEREKREISQTNEFLRQRVVNLEKLVKCEDCTLLKQMNWLNLQSSARTVLDDTW